MEEVHIFTDGSCLKNPNGPGGWASIIQHKVGALVVKEEVLSGANPCTTSNKMELQAATEPLKTLGKYKGKIVLTTDSTYVQKGITEWMTKWKRNGWKTSQRKPVKNQDLWIKLDEAIAGINVTWKWTKAHVGHPENERVDKEARRRANEAKAHENTEDKKGPTKRPAITDLRVSTKIHIAEDPRTKVRPTPNRESSPESDKILWAETYLREQGNIKN